ncbi:hypothetical protein MRX96_039763 [Rhipicephalus microplus]
MRDVRSPFGEPPGGECGRETTWMGRWRRSIGYTPLDGTQGGRLSRSAQAALIGQPLMSSHFEPNFSRTRPKTVRAKPSKCFGDKYGVLYGRRIEIGQFAPPCIYLDQPLRGYNIV